MIVAVVMGAAAGIVSGLLGVGGGILFVPALTLALSLSQVQAEATSLLAIIPVALVGALRQRRYGNVDLRDGVILGTLSALGVLGGVALANVLPERALKLSFAALALVVAAQFLRRFARSRARAGAAGPDASSRGRDACCPPPGADSPPSGARDPG
ncbi:MAG: TSUP family transporter [Solirubrobacteraceae bacterium]